MGGVFREAGYAHVCDKRFRLHIRKQRLRQKCFADSEGELCRLLAICCGQEYGVVALIVMREEISADASENKFFRPLLALPVVAVGEEAFRQQIRKSSRSTP